MFRSNASLRVRPRLAHGLLLAVLITVFLVSSRASSAVPEGPNGTASVVEERCLTNKAVVSPKRYVLYRSRTLPLVLESSYRMSHMLVTHVFRTFLVEILGYDNVQIHYIDDNFTTPAIAKRLGERDDDNNSNPNSVPESMVNLEVWIRPDRDDWWDFWFKSVYEAGAITNFGRFAWFTPDINETGLSGETWEIFTNLETADKFSFNSTEENDLLVHTKDSEGNFYCVESFCKNSTYVPERCNGRNGDNGPRCALLLASYGNMTDFVYHHIDKLKLYVKVMWVGPNLLKLKDLLPKPRAKANKSVVFLGWSPSDLVVQGEDTFQVIAFPTCEEMISRNISGCFYDLQRVMKMAWSQLGKAAPPAHDALQKISFEHNDYRQLMEFQRNALQKGLSVEDSVKSAACEWMKSNSEKWEHWEGIYSGNTNAELIIGGIFPLNSKSYKARGIAVAAKMASEAINRNNSLLRDYKINLLVGDGQCKPDIVMKTFIDYIYHGTYSKLVGVLGPACSDTVEPLAGVSTLYKTVVISYSAEGSTFPDRSKYPYFFRTIGENNQFNQVYLQLLQQIGWKQVASLTEDGQRYTEYLSHLQDILQNNGINFAVNRKFPRNWNATSMARYLEELKQKNAKIIIGDVYNEAARSLMCEAYLKNMTAQHGYVWFLPLWLSPRWYDTDNINDNSTVRVPCSTADMIEAINGHLSLTHSYYADDDAMMQEGITVREWRDIYERNCSSRNFSTHDYAGFAYDAVWTYAFALDKMMKENQSYLVTIHNTETINRYVQVLSDTDFMGVSGQIKFNGRSSRVSIIRVVQWIKNETRPVGTFYPNSSYPDGPGRLELNLSAIVWLTPDGKTPSDGTDTCFLSGLAHSLDISCEAALIVANVIGIVCLLTVSSVIFFVYKRRYDQKMKKMADTQKYMESLGLDLLSDTSELQKWEIPRHLVVLNRKLGEGAFGTVYGGETEIEGKGWVAVAVKTLKVGSTNEEKLDFLVEAEVMKRLDHKNIVKLIGVCTRNEPVYAVMEFMLYGDLKTYLLARRHLVNDKGGEESDEVSSKRLTSMALDVARALSYLAEIKFVHRDVASRNCLVNVSRMVKLGDFGMTRSLFDKDYYKFNKKAMLPVRWMSPESLSLGCFTHASDVWSYGVLLYEIITFGSFPFQGMTNAEVLEHVKQGHTLNIPRGVKAQLEGLIKSCWNLDYEKRPKASEIVDFLANNPRLLQPCLDAPLSSVQMDDSSQMEITLSGGLRKSSSNCYNRNHPRQPDADLLIDMQDHSAGASTMDSTVCPTEPLLGSPKNNTKGVPKFVNLPGSVPVAKSTDEYLNSHDLDIMSTL